MLTSTVRFCTLFVCFYSLAGQYAVGQSLGLPKADSLHRLYQKASGPRRAELALLIGDAMLYADMAQVRRFSLESLRQLEQYPNDTMRLLAMANLAGAYIGLGQHRRADSTFEVSIRLAKSLPNTQRHLATLLMNKALMYMDRGQNGKAVEAMKQALSQANHPGAVEVKPLIYSNFGYLYGNMGEMGRALYYFDLARQESERQHDRDALGLALANIATIYADFNQPRRSNQLLRQAIGYLEAEADWIMVSQCRRVLAENYLKLHQPDSAQVLALGCLRDAKKSGLQEHLIESNLLMANLRLEQRSLAGAERYAQAALQLARQENEGFLAKALYTAARTLNAQKRTDEALSFAREAVAVAQRTQKKIEQNEANDVLADVLEQAGNPAEALAVRKINEALADSLYSAGFREQFSYQQATYETEAKEQRIAFLGRENALRDRQVRWLKVGLGTLLALVGVIFWLYRRQWLNNKHIQTQNQQIQQQSDQLALLMRELHHRVKNNLQIVSSLLSLQSGRLVDQQARAAVRDGQSRVEAMSMLHQRLYTTDDVTSIDFRSYVTDLIESLMTTYGYRPDDFDLTIDIMPQHVDTDTAIPLGLIIHELITNSFKYAYRTVERPALTVRLERVETAANTSANALANGQVRSPQLRLTVRDNGPGLPQGELIGTSATALHGGVTDRPGTWSGGGAAAGQPVGTKSKSFGMQLVQSLAKQLRATSQFRSGDGLLFQLEMPS